MPTSDSASIDPIALVRDVVEGVDGEVFEVTVEPIGWHCRQCGGRFSVSDPASTPAWRHDGLVANLVESSEYHLRVDHTGSDKLSS